LECITRFSGQSGCTWKAKHLQQKSDSAKKEVILSFMEYSVKQEKRELFSPADQTVG
jgi:hypothetical protein